MNEIFYPSLNDFLSEVKMIKEAAAKKPDEHEITKEQLARIPKLADQDEVTSPYTGKVINMKKVKADMDAAKYKIVTQSQLYRPYIHEFDPVIYTWLVPTMATDGIRLFVNPEFADSLSWMGKIFVLIHEIMHCILMHKERGQGFDHKIFNIAGDLEINPIIVDTTDDFDEKFVTEEIQGLYDKKYLNIPVEQIYHDIIKNMPKLPPPPPGSGPVKIDPTQKPQPGGAPPPPPQGQQQPQKGEIEMKPGVKVRIKATGEKGIIKKVNKDGTFEVDPINESLFMSKLIIEGYKREELVPILPKSPGGGGGSGPQIDIQGEYEVEDDGKDEGKGEGEGEGKGKGDKKEGKEGKGKGSGGEDLKKKAKEMEGKAGKMETGKGEGQGSQEDMDAAARAVRSKMAQMDGGRTGGIIDTRTGEEIAKASGYDEEEIRAGEEGRAKWEGHAREMKSTLEKIKQAGSGRGDALINRLGKILKGVTNWKSLLKAYVGTALSPEKEYRLGAKKHLYKSEDYLKRGLKVKKDALKKCVVCVDVSGSMWSGNTFEKLMAEVNSIIFSKKIKEITVLFFDDGVDPGSVQTIKPKGEKVWKPKNIKGGGGTDFQKPLDWIKSHYNDNINLCIFLTDGYASNPHRPKYASKFIWVIFDNFDWTCPFGKAIYMSASDV